MKKLFLNQLRVIAFMALAFFFSNQLAAQVTTATLSGHVKDAKGEGLAAATVTVEFPDAGIRQVLVTRADGRFTVPNLRVGGPYRVTIHHVSHAQSVSDNIFL